MMNPELKVGDEIILYYMHDEISVPPGTKGVVTRISKDPTQTDDSKIIQVKWETGSTLSLLSNEDQWKLVKKNIKEESLSARIDPYSDFLDKNRDLRMFDMVYFDEFYKKIRNSGIVNMFGAAPLVYAGPEHIERYYGEGKEDNPAFQEVLDSAEEARNKFLSSLVKYAVKKNIDLDDEARLNNLAHKISIKLLQSYMLFFHE